MGLLCGQRYQSDTIDGRSANFGFLIARVTMHDHMFYLIVFLLMGVTTVLGIAITYGLLDIVLTESILWIIPACIPLEILFFNVIRVFISSSEGWIGDYVRSRGYQPDYNLYTKINEITDELL